MSFLPRMKFKIVTRRTPAEVRALLQSVTDSESKRFAGSKEKAFVGKVGEADFKIMPVLGEVTFLGLTLQVRNSFQPVITGQIRRSGSGTAVDVHMRLIWFVFGFCVVWFSLPVFSLLIALLTLVTEDPEWMMILFLAMFIFFGQILVRCWFYYPAKEARQKLEELLGAVGTDMSCYGRKEDS